MFRFFGCTLQRGFLLTSLLVLSFVLSETAAAAVAPKISGTPPTPIRVNSWFTFTPTVVDPDTPYTKLRFTIVNKPSWANFFATTGNLAGIPPTAGTWSNIKITVTDGQFKTTLPAFSLKATTTAAVNHAPKISGTPPTSVAVGSKYFFKPSASDSDGNTLGFNIQNRPSWASFSTSTGQLSGTPTSSNVGTFSRIKIWVSDGKTSVALPSFSITVTKSSGTGTGNAPPKISGTPATSIASGSTYSFTPTASDPEGKTLTFSISNKPSWASFSTSNGRLSGTPSSSQTGTYSNIVISVSDGTNKVSLPAFAITVKSTATTGSATLSWTPPTRNTDGSTLTNLAGYKIYYGTSSGAMNKTVQISNAGVSSYVIENLSPATYYFAVKAYTTTGVESALSNTASKVVK
ncbi:MAG TPA: putative Ig domain-containing protein [Steroidobacteraceae bacterium]|nr:putative Ig domain-containing protein [Steroidobacteraceae bacterium]